MKNKEKYAKEIIEIAINGKHIAFDKQSKRLVACSFIRCEDCLFHGVSSCTLNFLKWANSEYKEKKKFSEVDKAFVKAMDKLNWFAKDKSGIVYGYVDKPFRNGAVWGVDVEVGDNYALASASRYTSATLEALSWEDEEPTHRSEILEE